MLRELINQFYKDSFKERDRKYFYITDAGKCPRAVYFRFKKVPRKEPEPRVLRIFDMGDYTHMRLMSVLFSLGIVRAVEIKTPSPELVHGRADAIIGSEDGKPIVVELKSSSGYKFDKLTEPEPDHLKQIQLYMHYFKIPQGILLYENKNTQELKEFIVKYDLEFAQKTIKELEVLKEHIEKDVVPPIPKVIEDWRCRYCEYQKECQRTEKSKFKKFKEPEKLKKDSEPKLF